MSTFLYDGFCRQRTRQIIESIDRQNYQHRKVFYAYQEPKTKNPIIIGHVLKLELSFSMSTFKVRIVINLLHLYTPNLSSLFVSSNLPSFAVLSKIALL